MAFTHYTVKKIVHGLGAIKQAPVEVKNLKGSKAFIVTDPGLAKIGVQKPLEEALTAGGVEWKLYAEAQLEPSMDSIQHCTDEAKAFGADVIIGFGGGSALDTTKAASVLLSNEGPIDKYFGMNLVPNPCLPSILIPTTAGTGSEMTNISVLADTKNGGKKGVVSEYMYADVVILDAELTFGLPPKVTAMTGVDAFVHAMESFCGIAATPITDALNLQAMKLVAGNIRQAYANGKNAAARDAMLYGSALAGMGFGNTQNGIIHAIGTTLPVECHIPHGLAMSFCAPFSVGFNYIANPEKYAIVADRYISDEQPGRNNVPIASRISTPNTSLKLSSYYVEDASFFRCANITLGYTLPKRWMSKLHVSSCRVYFSGDNLFTITPYRGYNPEVSYKSSNLMPGFDWGCYPLARIYSLGLNLTF